MTYSVRDKKSFSSVTTVLLIAATVIFNVFLSDKISHSVKVGLSLCANVIIPSVFPFLILSDFLYANLDFSSIKFVGKTFTRLFKIGEAGVYAFILGALCGFPLGVKCAAELYENGRISRDEAERLIGFCNNTGPAFLICGVGLGLRGDIADGILLYFSMIISASLVGIIFSIGKNSSSSQSENPTKKLFSITASIKNAGASILNICAYLTFFACALGILRGILGENLLYISLVPFFEVGSAASILSKTHLINRLQSLALTSFAVSFSGLSVHLQALSFIDKTDLSAKKYFAMKTVQGIISAIITALILYISE